MNIIKRCAKFTDWAFTLTLKPEVVKNLSACEQYELIVADICERLNASDVIFHSLLQFEVTKNNNIHIHCYFQTNKQTIKNLRSHLHVLLNLAGVYGFYWLKPTTDIEGWISYINKDPFYIERFLYAF